jgi:myosin heavy subunit
MALYSKDAVGDLVLLETIDEANILSTLKRRYAKDLIYTYIG